MSAITPLITILESNIKKDTEQYEKFKNVNKTFANIALSQKKYNVICKLVITSHENGNFDDVDKYKKLLEESTNNVLHFSKIYSNQYNDISYLEKMETKLNNMNSIVNAFIYT
jgi:hypothetical protein